MVTVLQWKHQNAIATAQNNRAYRQALSLARTLEGVAVESSIMPTHTKEETQRLEDVEARAYQRAHRRFAQAYNWAMTV